MKESFSERIDKLRSLLDEAECVLIGGGSGLSSAAGLTYSGQRFTENFGDFIKKYGMSDMYSAGFYPFKTQEEKWAYWSRHILLNRLLPPALPLYRRLFNSSRIRTILSSPPTWTRSFIRQGLCPSASLPCRATTESCNAQRGATTSCMTTKISFEKWRRSRKTAAFLPLSFQSAPCAAEKWRSISAKTPVLYKIRRGMRRSADMSFFAVRLATGSYCFWSLVWDTIRRR